MSFSVALLVSVALVALTACSSSEDSIAEAPTPSTPDAPKTYTMTVTASKADNATTRALGLSSDEKTLNATWAEGEKIKVLKKVMNVDHDIIYKYLGTLSATTVNGQTATFTGSLDADKVSSAGDLHEGDKLLLAFPGSTLGSDNGLTFNYTGQDGTLGKIASSYDYCMTPTSGKNMVTVASVNDGVVTTTSAASFVNQQAIVRFTLKDASGNAIYPTSLDITVNGLEKTYNPLDEYGPVPSGDQTLTLTPNGSTNVIYVALRGISYKDVTLIATCSNRTIYNYTKSSVTFQNGKYYAIDVKMGKDYVDLSTLNNNYTAENGVVLTGTTHDIHLYIAAGASVTLNCVDINLSSQEQAAITCLGDATINLVGSNMIIGGYYPGIQAGGSGTTLTIQGSGSVYAMGGQKNAGIGSRVGGSCGAIIINGGTVEASGGSFGAGIGSGGSDSSKKGSCGEITINGGTVTAHGGLFGAGIGSGDEGTCGAIIINGGTVTATGGNKAAGIGSGDGGTFESIKITKDITRVTATMGSDAQAPIGRGNNDQGSGSVTVDDVTNWAGSATTNLNFSSTNNTWTLTPR